MSASRTTVGALAAVIAAAALMSPASSAFVPASNHRQSYSSPFFNSHRTTFKATTITTITTTTAPKTHLSSSMNRDDLYNFFNDKEFDDEDEDEYEKYRHLSKTEKQELTKTFGEQMKVEVKPEEVHIILFNPNTDREGVHTIEFPKDSGNNIILAFESRMECEKFSMNLKEQHFYDPVPQEMNLDSLEEYCETIGVDVQVVPQGTNLKPPKEKAFNLGLNPDLEKEVELLDYLFQISQSDDSARGVGGRDGLGGGGEGEARRGSTHTSAWE